MSEKIVVKSFDTLSVYELYEIISLREQVFVVEQNCAYLDCDGKDKLSKHLWIEAHRSIVAYTRLVPPLSDTPHWSIGRVVVHPEFRGLSLGKKVMQASIKLLNGEMGAQKIVISAQIYLLKFYNDLGFSEEGESYLEDDIPHIKMVWRAYSAVN